MKIGDLVLSWAFSVVVGSLLIGVFLGTLPIAILFAIVSGLFSIPYLVLMILLSRKRTSFLSIQLIHIVLSMLTGIVIVLFENNMFEGWYVLALYFVLGVSAQAFFYFRKPLDKKYFDEELLDG